MKSTNQVYIQDWAGNTLQHDGRFNFGAYGKNRGVPKMFKSFDDAEGYLCELFEARGLSYEEERGEYYIEDAKQ